MQTKYLLALMLLSSTLLPRGVHLVQSFSVVFLYWFYVFSASASH
jgi:hypothetical protein